MVVTMRKFAVIVLSLFALLAIVQHVLGADNWTPSGHLEFKLSQPRNHLRFEVNPDLQAQVDRDWGHDAESRRLMFQISTQQDAYQRLFRFIEAMASRHLEAVGEELARLWMTYYYDDGRMIGFRPTEAQP